MTCSPVYPVLPVECDGDGDECQDPTREFRKVFVYAPPTAGPAVNKMLKDLGLDKTWDAEPVSAGTALRESGLTTILEAALASARSRERYIHTCSSVLYHVCRWKSGRVGTVCNTR